MRRSSDERLRQYDAAGSYYDTVNRMLMMAWDNEHVTILFDKLYYATHAAVLLRACVRARLSVDSLTQPLHGRPHTYT
jgi:hypothetical protein